MVESLKGVEIFALVVARVILSDEELADSDNIRCLIVRPSEGDSITMQRIGLVNLTRSP